MTNNLSPVPVLGISAYSGTGKTTLLSQLIPRLKAVGLRLAIIKHGHHKMEVDTPGKDSYTYREAGADQVVLASSERIIAMHERKTKAQRPTLAETLAYVDIDATDLILIEGFKHETYPKIELYRPSLQKPLLFPQDDSVIAVASDAPIPDFQALLAGKSTRPILLDLNNLEDIVIFIQGYLE